jgi:hypothetical protein
MLIIIIIIILWLLKSKKQNLPIRWKMMRLLLFNMGAPTGPTTISLYQRLNISMLVTVEYI